MNAFFFSRAARMCAAGLGAAAMSQSFAGAQSIGDEDLQACQRDLGFYANLAQKQHMDIEERNDEIASLNRDILRMQDELNAHPSRQEWEQRKADLNGRYHTERQRANAILDMLQALPDMPSEN